MSEAIGKVRIVLKYKSDKEKGLTKSKTYLKLPFLQPTSMLLVHINLGYLTSEITRVLNDKLRFVPTSRVPGSSSIVTLISMCKLFIWFGSPYLALHSYPL